MPVYTIASNAGVEGSIVVSKLLEQDNPDLGYDAAKGLSSSTIQQKQIGANDIEIDHLHFSFSSFR